MKGFIIESIGVEVSDVIVDKIKIDNGTTVDGQKYKDATAIIKFQSIGDVEDITGRDLMSAINNKLGDLINLDNES